MKRTRIGFTLVELLVVITIIGILMGLLIPAVNAARETARKTECGVNVKNLALAAIQHENTKGSLPKWINKYGVFPGGVDRSDLGNYGGTVPAHVKVGGYGVAILPWLEAQPVYEHWTDDSYPCISDGTGSMDMTGAVGASNAGIGFHILAAPNLGNFQCASNPNKDAQQGRNSYITNNGMAYLRTAAAATANGGASGFSNSHIGAQALNNGVFKAGYVGGLPLPSPADTTHGVGPSVTLDDLKDGKTNTVLFSENVQALPWHLPGFLHGGGGTGAATPNLLSTTGELLYSVVNVTGVGEMNASQFSAGMVWHYEDKDAAALNSAAPTYESPTGLDVGNKNYTYHKINGGGPTVSDDIYTLQMTLSNAQDIARPSSAHVDGVNMGFADGSNRYVISSIDYRVYQAMMTPRGKSSDVPWPEFVLTDELGD